MRILMFVHCFYPEHIFGTEAYTLAVAKELQARGYEVRVVTTTLQDEPLQPAFVEEYEWEGVQVTRLDKNLVRHNDIMGTYYQAEMRPIHERVLRSWKPDLVHINHPISHTVALHEVCAALGIPTVGTLTDFFGICLNNKLQASDGSLCSGPNARRSNCIACQLTAMSALPNTPAAKLRNRPLKTKLTAAALSRGWCDAKKSYGFSVEDVQQRPDLLKERYQVFRELIAPSTFLLRAYQQNNLNVPLRLSHFGVELDRGPKPSRGEGEPLHIGYVGQIAPHKGTHLLIEAVRKLGAGAKVEVEIWGDPNQDPTYMARLRELAGGLDVSFRGTFRAANTASILGAMDLMVIPSVWYENSPLILLQALATHTPCVVSDVLGMTEFVSNGISGFAFKRGSVASLAKVLARFTADRTLAARMSQTTNYTRTTADMVNDIEAMYVAHGLTSPAPQQQHEGDRQIEELVHD